MSSLRASAKVAFCAGLFGLGVAAGGFGQGERVVAAPRACEPVEAAAPKLPVPARPRAAPTGAVVRPAQLFVATDEAAAAEYRATQSKDLVDLIRRNVAHAELMSMPGMPAEAAANTAFPYLRGWVDSVMRTAPDLLDELSAEIARGACDPKASEAQRVTMYRLATMYPDVSSESTFSCVLEGDVKEDLVLWSALDAFGVSGLPKPAALLELERTAKDPRTKRRLMSREQLFEQLDELAQTAANPPIEE